MQTITIFFILGILFVLFSAFAEDYYFSRKIGVIKQSFSVLQKEDISGLTYKNRYIISFEEQKLRFVIANEKFEPIYVTSRIKNLKPMAQNAKAKAKVENSIVMMSEKTYDNLIENIYLTQNKRNFDWLMESKRQLEVGKTIDKNIK